MKKALIPNLRLYGTEETASPNLFFNIVRIGHVNKQTKQHYVPHRHSQIHEVVWLSAGHLTLTIDKAVYLLEPNTLCVIAAGSVHESVTSPELDAIVMHFSTDFLLSELGEAPSRLLALLPLHGTLPLPIESVATTARIRGLFACLEAESILVGPEKNELIRHYLHILLLEMQRTAGLARAIKQDAASSMVPCRFVALIEQHYMTKKQVSDYADLLHLTPNYLNVLIKRTTGRTAGQLIRDRVILEAKRLFLFSEATISEVANALNYDDVSYFWRLFKKEVHLSPTEFKKRGLGL